MTEQERQKADVRSRLERIWFRWQAGIARRDHQLVVLAVPTYPGNIEAVSAMDMQDVADLLAAFTEHRKANPNELHAIKPVAEPASRQDWKPLDEGVTDGQAAGAGPEPVGQGNDGGGAPQERPDAPAEPNEGHAAVDALDLIEQLNGAIGAVKSRDRGAIHEYLHNANRSFSRWLDVGAPAVPLSRLTGSNPLILSPARARDAEGLGFREGADFVVEQRLDPDAKA